jgi:autotransporter adhesin
MAAAGVPQSFTAGGTTIGIGLGTWGSQAAFSFGASHTFGRGQTTVKIGASFDSRGDGGVSTGIGWSF